MKKMKKILCALLVVMLCLTSAPMSMGVTHNHDWKLEKTVQVTCEQDGYSLYKCECGQEYIDNKVEKIGHKLTQFITVKEGTCTEKGLEEARCYFFDECGYSETYSTATGNHSFVTTEIDPTCTEPGFLQYQCTYCSYMMTEAVKPANGHSFSDIIVEEKATCSEKGKKIVKCINCDATTEIDIPATGHKLSTIEPVPSTCTEPGKTQGSFCQVCGTIFEEQKNIPALGHNMFVSQVIRTATTERNGSCIYTCNICGEISEIITVANIDENTICLSETTYNYDGNRKTPYVTVKDTDGKELIKDKDYSVFYDSGRIKPGTYYVTVEFKGCYEGTYELSFEINDYLNIRGFDYTSNNTSIFIDWEDAIGADVYRVYEYSKGDYNLIDTVSESQCEIRKLKPETEYDIAIEPGDIQEDGTTKWGSWCEFTVETSKEPKCDHIDENLDRICDVCEKDSSKYNGDKGDTQFKLYNDGTLVVSGEGYAECGWNNYREFIKKVIVEEGITGLSAGCFAYCINMESISLPSTLTSIGDNAFYYCERMKAINIPKSVTMLGEGVFAGCISLEKLVVPEGVKEIYYYFASGCTALKEVKLPSTLEGLGDAAFAKCSSLEKIDLPANLKRINGAFFDCTALKELIIPYGVTTIGNDAFRGCENIAEIEIPDTVTTIGGSAFAGTSIVEIEIPDSVTYLGALAFLYCEKLESVILSDNIEIIEEQTFCGCSSLKKITIPDKVEKIRLLAFAECTSLEEINMPETIEILSSYAFSGCESLKSINLPDALTGIDWGTFSGMISLKDIVIPEKVVAIADLGFAGCSTLKTVTMYNNIEMIIDTAFIGCDSLTDVYFYGSEAEWNEIYFGEGNDPLLNATIHFLGEEECTHKETFEQTIPASCTVDGMKFTICVDCGETIGNPEVIPAAHTPGEWETVLEPTYEAEGKKVKKCTVCGEILEEEIIPKLELTIVEDEKTGVGIEYPKDKYDGDVDIKVEESFDGTAFNILDAKTGAVQQKIYDIKMFVGGEETQPNGKITVKIPLPSDYNPKFSFVYYVNTEKGTVEKMDAKFEDGYMVFETDHFSYYAIIAEPDVDNCSCNCHKGGFMGFIWNIINFFQKLFKINGTCACGVAHY